MRCSTSLVSQLSDCLLLLQVLRSGSYEAVFFYTSLSDATMKLSIGPYDDISSGAATSVTVILPMQVSPA